jgi:hypothetical protein
MTLGEFKTLIRSMVPSANRGAVDNTLLEVLINKGVKEVNNLAMGYCDEVYFSIVADIEKYNIRDIATDFVIPGKSGMWMNKGTVAAPTWDQLDAVNRAYLDRNHPNWINTGSGTPLYYFVEAGKVITYPTPDAALANGFWFPDYIKAPTKMTVDTQYPFTATTSELSDLEPLDDAIIDYVRWHLKHSVGSDQKGLVTRQEFEGVVRRCSRLIGRRPDYISNHRKFRIRGRRA